MWTWAAGQPPTCLRIGAQKIVWVDTSLDWRWRRHHHCRIGEIPTGIVRPSPVEPNIIDRDKLEIRLRDLIGPASTLRLVGKTLLSDLPRPIMLIIPDLSVRAMLLQLDQLPARAEEREALIRWRVGQEQLTPLTGVKVVSQVLSTHASGHQGPLTILAVACQEAILAQYESVCEAAGLIPLGIDIVSFRLFNLWTRATADRSERTRDLIWVNLSDGALTVLIFHAGSLVFLRTKSQSGARASAQAATVSLHEGARKIAEECADSLYACKQICPQLAVTHCVVIAEDPEPGLEEVLEEQLGLTVAGLDWAWLENTGWRPVSHVSSPAALPAIAGAV